MAEGYLNEQGGPWRRRPKEEGPPDLVQLLKALLGKKQKPTSEGGAPAPSNPIDRFLKRLIIPFLLVIWVLSGFFIVKPAEEAVIVRFGHYVETVGPGLHWIPSLITRQFTLDVQRIASFKYESEMLTKDENIVSVSLAVQYRVEDPKDFLFNVVGPERAVQQATSSALRQAVGHMALDNLLTTGRAQLRQQVIDQLNEILVRYHAGVKVMDVRLLPVKPPEAVTHAFDDAIKAREDEQRYINQAEAYAREVTSIAKGKAARLVQAASAYQKRVVLDAEGNVARYLALLRPYERAQEVTKTRLYLDMMRDVLSRTTNILVDGKGNNMMYLPLADLLKRQKRHHVSFAASALDKSSAWESSRDAADAEVEAEVSRNAPEGSTVYHRVGARPAYTRPGGHP